MTFSDDELRTLDESDDPTDALGILLNTHVSDLLLDGLNAGWTQNEEVIVKHFERDDDTIYAACSISYDQLRYGGCEDSPHSDPCFESCNLTVELDTGDVTVEQEEDYYAE